MLSAILENTEVKETAERGNILKIEQAGQTRLKSVGGFETTIGMMAPMTDALGTYTPMYGIGFGYIWDLDPFLLEARTDFMGGFNKNKKFAISGNLGADYILYSGRQYAVFTGMELGFAKFRGDYADYGFERSKSGFLVGGDFGAILFRHADVNLDLRLRTMVLTDKLNGSVPVLGGLLVGIRF